MMSLEKYGDRNGQGSVIEDIKDYMNEAEKDQYYEYRGDYGNL